VPAANHYSKILDWSKDLEFAASPDKGKFKKSKRTTLVEEILGQKDKSPGPGTYDYKKTDKIIGLVKSNQERGAFIDDAKYYATTSPGFIYKTDVSFIRPRSLVAKYYPAKEVKKPKKADGPSVGSYDIDKAIEKT